MITARLKVSNSAEIQKNGLEALKQALGVIGTIKLLEQFDHGGSGDYTREKYEMMKDFSILQESLFTVWGSAVEMFTDLTVRMGIRNVTTS